MSMPRKKNGGTQKASHERWLITYADLITLLMVFFIVMYAMSTVNHKKYESLASSLQIAFNSGSGQNVVTNFQGEAILASMKTQLNDGGVRTSEDNELRAVEKQTREYIEKNELEKSIRLALTERGLVISLVDTVLFPSGQAELTPQAKLILNKLAGIIAKVPNQIRIEGHTDNIPISNTRFPSNWELSTARATQLVAYFVEKHGLPPQNLSAAGYSEYRPIVPNNSEANRALNRRVDIVILRTNLNKQEPQGLREQLIKPQTEILSNTQ